MYSLTIEDFLANLLKVGEIKSAFQKEEFVDLFLDLQGLTGLAVSEDPLKCFPRAHVYNIRKV